MSKQSVWSGSRRTGLAGKTSLDSGELEGIVDAMEAGWCP